MLERASVPVLVVESWGPVVGLVLRDYCSRAFAVADPIVIVVCRELAAANYIVNMLAIARKLSELA